MDFVGYFLEITQAMEMEIVLWGVFPEPPWVSKLAKSSQLYIPDNQKLNLRGSTASVIQTQKSGVFKLFSEYF